MGVTQNGISQLTLIAFANALAANGTVGLIRDAFQGAGIERGESTLEVSGERRKAFFDFVSSIAPGSPTHQSRLRIALSYLLAKLEANEFASSAAAELVRALRRDGFRWDGASIEPLSDEASASAPVVDEIEAFLRAIPRGLRELDADHRYDKRQAFVVDDEHDLQDFVRAFIRMRFPAATHEEQLHDVAGVAGRVDFAIAHHRVHIELKVFESDAQWRKTMFPDVCSKIERYTRDDKCDVLFIVVYDPDHKFTLALKAQNDLSGERTVKGKTFDVRFIVTPLV